MNILNRLMDPNLIFLIPAILIGLTVHEFSHAYVSYRLGDPTPKYQNRLTLNPIDHIDPIGLISLILFRFGWGKPVQINPRNYKNPRVGEILVSIAGPASNLLMVIVFSFILKFTANIAFQYTWYYKLMIKIIQLNAVLCVFNLLPLPPLDGSKILLNLLPLKNKYTLYQQLQRYSMPIFLLLVFSDILGTILTPLINLVLQLHYFILML